jgi:uncharacterized protein YqhQ
MNIQSSNEETSLAFGGQALIEGVMMRSGVHMVLCVRREDNEIVTRSEIIKSRTKMNPVLGLPVIRGIVMLVETMYYGVKGMIFSANISLGEEDQFTVKELIIVLIMVLAMNVFFIAIPFTLTTYLHLEGALFNTVESILRIALFTGYLFLVSRWGEFRRVLQYHGAEHKAVNAHEAGSDMTIENVKTFSRLNPRCGTSFLFLTLVVSIALFSMINSTDFITKLTYRLLLIPVIGGVSYEALRLSNKYRNSIVMKLLTIPGLAFQRFTTYEPDDDMIEVAIAALEHVKHLNLNDGKG